ncbi:MAG: hypothetical protein JXA20_11135 [Spirochaetes bacterium]|nr:hypothetical protein [Spirochaetota bacterium]
MTATIDALFASEAFKLVGIPLLIFITKIIDVTLSTLGLIFTSRGYKKLSSVMSFFEICVYLFAIAQIIDNLTNIAYYISYAGGYTLGTYMGIHIEEKLSIGYISLRVVTRKKPDRLIVKLKKIGYEVTSFQARSLKEKVRVVHAVFRRRDANAVTEMLRRFDKNALYSIEDLKRVNVPMFHRAT